MSRARALHFTLGPVQGFVASARRTRDLWAGSFILSWLSGCAMLAVTRHGGGLSPDRIVLPAVQDDPMYLALAGGQGSPGIGSLPNRFKARIADGFDPEDCRQALGQKWCELADAVWEVFVSQVADCGRETREIWSRQVNSFWETAWVVGEEPEAGNDIHWPNMRKNWRTHIPSQEGGDHCMLIPELQEISGFIRSTEATSQDAFWNALRGAVKQAPSATGLDLRVGERLSAIALIKRLFPVLPEDRLRSVIGWLPGADQGGNVQAWPSVAFMSAAQWLRIASSRFPDTCVAYHKLVQRRLRRSIHRRSAISLPMLKESGEIASIDGSLFFEASIDAAVEDQIEPDDREKLADELKTALRRIYSNEGVGEPSPFYALLILDGDHLGALLRRYHGREGEVSQAIGAFASSAPEVIGRHNGVTIYAGGDDLLALLPLEEALGTAIELESSYRTCFEAGANATISAGLVFAHLHVPLRAVVAEAHRMLEDVAKTGNRRNSIGISVLKPGGQTVEWVSAWRNADDKVPALLFTEIAKAIEQTDQSEDTGFSNSYFYSISERYGAVFEDAARGKLDREQLRLVFEAEYLKARAACNRSEDLAPSPLIKDLLTVCEKHVGDSPATDAKGAEQVGLQASGLILARFLGSAGVWHD